MMANRYTHKRTKRRYRKIMASLTGAAILSSAMFSGVPVAKANESVKSSPDALTELLLRSKDEVETKLKEKLTEKAAEAINSVRDNPALINAAIEKTKDVLQERLKTGIEEMVLEKKAEIEQSIADKWNQKTAQANRVIDITATAYASGPEDNGIWNDKTHIGTKVRPGIIAVDPQVIPLGSKVYIEFEDGTRTYAVAEDTGGAIKGNRIDIAMNSREQAKEFGIQNVKVHVVEEGTIA